MYTQHFYIFQLCYAYTQYACEMRLPRSIKNARFSEVFVLKFGHNPVIKYHRRPKDGAKATAAPADPKRRHGAALFELLQQLPSEGGAAHP